MVQYKDESLRVALGKGEKVLAVGLAGDEVVMAGSASKVAVRLEGRWHVMGWHQVERGSWRSQTKRFRWFDTEGERYEVELDDIGQLPELFQERVQASTLLTEQYDLDPGVVRIIARRALDAGGAIRFFAAASGGASLADPSTAALVVAETDRLKAEYGIQ